MLHWIVIGAASLAMGSPAAAAPADCAARAERVVEALSQDAAQPLSLSERALARQAARAACEEESAQADAPAPETRERTLLVGPAGASEAGEPEASGSRLDRFFAGLFSMEPRPAKTRPGGKFRYLEKE